jgi:DNA-binding transcriptional MerR regulator
MLISRLAQLSGMSKDGIRHYEELGIIRSTRRQAGSRWYRDYDERELDMIEKARQAQQLGLSLKEIALLLKAMGDREVTHSETIAFLQERLTVIRGRMDELRRIEDFIVQKLERYQGSQG